MSVCCRSQLCSAAVPEVNTLSLTVMLRPKTKKKDTKLRTTEASTETSQGFHQKRWKLQPASQAI